MTENKSLTILTKAADRRGFNAAGQNLIVTMDLKYGTQFPIASIVYQLLFDTTVFKFGDIASAYVSHDAIAPGNIITAAETGAPFALGKTLSFDGAGFVAGTGGVAGGYSIANNALGSETFGLIQSITDPNNNDRSVVVNAVSIPKAQTATITPLPQLKAFMGSSIEQGSVLEPGFLRTPVFASYTTGPPIVSSYCAVDLDNPLQTTIVFDGSKGMFEYRALPT